MERKRKKLQQLYVTHDKNKNILRVFFIITAVVVVVLVGLASFYFYDQYQKNPTYFLQEISQYDDSKSFVDAWPRIILKTKTPMQYLMVLKRLDKHGATEEYKNTLLRALYKYTDVHSFLALAVDYYLSYYDGEVFEEFLDNVNELWNEYPHLVRMYYIRLYESKKIRYEGDEILDIFYEIQVGNYTWNTLKLLWELTDEPKFLYFASIQADIHDKQDIAKSLYDDLPIEEQVLHSDHYIELAWILKDTEFLLPIVKSNKNVTEYIKLASYYVLENKPFRAYNLLVEALELFPEASIRNVEFLSIYFWLSLYQVNQKHVMLLFLDKMQEVEYAEAQVMFMLYLYQYDIDVYNRYVKSVSPDIMEIVSQDDHYFFFKLNIENASIEQRKVFLWNLLNKKYSESDGGFNVGEAHWVKMASNFFLNHRLLDDFLLLYDKYNDTYTIDLIPYYLFFKLNFVDLPLTELEVQNILVNSDVQNYPWWFFYNLGVWKLSSDDLLVSKEYFEKTLNIIDLQHTIGYKEYPLAQLVRIAILSNDIEKAEEIFSDLTTLFPVNPLLFGLESSIKQYKSLRMEGENTE